MNDVSLVYENGSPKWINQILQKPIQLVFEGLYLMDGLKCLNVSVDINNNSVIIDFKNIVYHFNVQHINNIKRLSNILLIRLDGRHSINLSFLNEIEAQRTENKLFHLINNRIDIGCIDTTIQTYDLNEYSNEYE